MDNKKEIRNTTREVRVAQESRRVEGYALLFDTASDGLGFEEVIERGALDGVVESCDVFALLDHSNFRGVLARSKNGKGTLSLEVDDTGLRYSFDAPDTALGDELIAHIRSGNIDSSSFAFTVADDSWEKKSDGMWKRSIRKIERLYDVSPVYSAAYSQTSVYMRGKEQAEQELAVMEKRKQEADLSAYYENLHNSLIY
jgi:HK97 family phage prohead protease